ncbi:MAG: FAD-binding oxidoreductase [Anaerolineae bacterium]|nr:FAD-binding oxidoreductase [Anaerolineae bacterium]
MTVSIWQADGTQPRQTVDCLIVGAGLVGCAAAYFAAQQGASVAITEMRDVALGASGRNAGFMITGLDAYYHHAIERYGHDITREVYALSEQTHHHWHGFIRRNPDSVRFEPCGSTLLAETPEEVRDLELAYAAMQADGISAIYCETDPLDRGYLAAIQQPQDGSVQPVELTWAILRESGATLYDNNELYHLEQIGPDQVMVYTRKVVFQAKRVLLCTNAYSPNIHPYFIGKVIPTRAQCLVTEPLPAPVLNTCGYSDYGFMYYRMTFDGRLLIGGGRKQNKPLEHDTMDDRINTPVQVILEAYLRDRFPEVSAPIARRWAGIMGFTPDGLPLVGSLPDQPAIGFAVGFNGHGLALGAATVERAIAHLFNGQSPGALSVNRL